MTSTLAVTVDALLFVLSIGAFIVGTTPPAFANKESKARASKATGDLISRYNISSNGFRYIVHGAFVALAAVHVYALYLGAVGTSTQPLRVWHKLIWQQLRAGTTGSSGSLHAAIGRNASRWLQYGAHTSFLPAFLTSHLAYRLSCLFAVAAAAGRVSCYRSLGRFFTFDLAVQDGQKVIDTGLYGYVRHPSYTAMLVATISNGYAVAIGPLIPPAYHSLAVAFSIFSTIATTRLVQLRIKDEEGMLLAELGTAYKQYIKKVPFKLIPGLY